MAATYEPIASTTLASSTSSFTFSNIPQTYTDLVVIRSGEVVATNSYMRLNGVSTALYSVTTVSSYGGSAISRQTSASGDTQLFCEDLGTGVTRFHIMNYTNTSVNKTLLMSGGSTFVHFFGVGLYRSTSAITSVTLGAFGSYAAGSVFSLYGIKAA